jgi:hypothetical protein
MSNPAPYHQFHWYKQPFASGTSNLQCLENDESVFGDSDSSSPRQNRDHSKFDTDDLLGTTSSDGLIDIEVSPKICHAHSDSEVDDHATSPVLVPSSPTDSRAPIRSVYRFSQSPSTDSESSHVPSAAPACHDYQDSQRNAHLSQASTAGPTHVSQSCPPSQLSWSQHEPSSFASVASSSKRSQASRLLRFSTADDVSVRCEQVVKRKSEDYSEDSRSQCRRMDTHPAPDIPEVLQH